MKQDHMLSYDAMVKALTILPLLSEGQHRLLPESLSLIWLLILSEDST